MIKLIKDLLALDDFYGVSENIDIAKGKYQLPKGFKGIIKKAKRIRNGSN
jgi:hypothetical protein